MGMMILSIFCMCVCLGGFEYFVAGNPVKAFTANAKETISFYLIQNLKIQHCIVTEDWSSTESFSFGKFFLKQKIMTGFKNYETLSEYLILGGFPNFNTVIISSEPNFLKLARIFKNLENLNLLYRTHYFTWLVFVESFDLIEANLNDLSVPYDCLFIVSYPTGEASYKLTEIYKVKNTTFISDLGVWNGALKINNFPYYVRRNNLNGTKLQIDHDTNSDTGLADDQWEILYGISKIMNFDFTYFEVPLIADLAAQIKGDIWKRTWTLHSLYYIPNFMGPIFVIKIPWYIRYPEAGKSSDYYIRPFHEDLWMALICCVIFNGIFIPTLLVVVRTYLRKDRRIFPIDAVFMAFELLCDQLGVEDPKSSPLRITTFALHILAMLILHYFSAVIISFLAVPIPIIPFHNVEEFLQNEQYKCILWADNFVELILRKSNNPSVEELYQNHSLFDTSVEKSFERLCIEKVALPFVNNEIYNFDVNCELLEIEHPLMFLFTGLALQVNSPFKKAFNYNLIRFFTSGIQKKMAKRWKEIPLQSKTDEELLAPVEIDQMFQVLAIVPVGIIIAVVMFAIEQLFLRFRKNPTLKFHTAGAS